MKLVPLRSTTRSTYPCKQRKSLEGRMDRQQDILRAVHFGIVLWNLTSSWTTTSHQLLIFARQLLCSWPKLGRKHHTSTQTACLGTMESIFTYSTCITLCDCSCCVVALPAKVPTSWTMSYCTMSNINLPQKKLASKKNITTIRMCGHGVARPRQSFVQPVRW